jgi:hypothetical protein
MISRFSTQFSSRVSRSTSLFSPLRYGFGNRFNQEQGPFSENLDSEIQNSETVSHGDLSK